LNTGWDNSSVPKRNWNWENVEDQGPGEFDTCEMCGNPKVRYIHIMTHPRHDGPVRVGCVCAAAMSDEPPEKYQEREKLLRSKAAAFKRWKTRRWRLSQKGNPTVCVDGNYMTVFKSRGGWGTVIEGEFSRLSYPTEEAAKLSLFEEYWNRHHPATKKPVLECSFTADEYRAATEDERVEMISTDHRILTDTIIEELPYLSKHNSWEVEIEDFDCRPRKVDVEFTAVSLNDGEGQIVHDEKGTLHLYIGIDVFYDVEVLTDEPDMLD